MYFKVSITIFFFFWELVILYSLPLRNYPSPKSYKVVRLDSKLYTAPKKSTSCLQFPLHQKIKNKIKTLLSSISHHVWTWSCFQNIFDFLHLQNYICFFYVQTQFQLLNILFNSTLNTIYFFNSCPNGYHLLFLNY